MRLPAKLKGYKCDVHRDQPWTADILCNMTENGLITRQCLTVVGLSFQWYRFHRIVCPKILEQQLSR